MAIIVSQISLPLGASEREAERVAVARLGLQGGGARASVCRRSVDARRRDHLRMVYSVQVEVPGSEQAVLQRLVDQKNIALQRPPEPLVLLRGDRPLRHRPVVVGTGPAGLFAGLLLAREGYRPLLLERGPDIARRTAAVEAFWRGGRLDERANVQFGEGGAGAFSDGKLTTRIGDPRCRTVLEALVQHGAPQRILIDAKPHVGTDRLREVVRSLRGEILSLGGELRFDCRVERLLLSEGRLVGLACDGGELPCEVAVLAIGHSARDTVQALSAQGVRLEKKPFSVGVRIEHEQALIDRLFYGAAAGHPALPPAEYQLSHRVGQRGCYSFCMCPGGLVVPAASEPLGVVTNGMSYAARDGRFANAAIVASVLPEDLPGGPLEGLFFQRRLEQAACRAGGGDYAAPGQSARSYLEGGPPVWGGEVTYARGLRPAKVAPLLPAAVDCMLRAGLARFEAGYPGFAGAEALLIGLETRTSSPLRMPRGGQLQSPSVEGLYPAGEGAGYAGGIVSAAVDGLRVAEAVIAAFRPHAPS
ncbi:MAG: NAD(P)-binding protein [Clostridiales bacterium]|nr:NAD(P)-binding protein [Clostridiales bacterium]